MKLPVFRLDRLHWFVDHSRHHHVSTKTSVKQRRALTLRAIESGGNNYLIVLVASLGLFADSYILFASNVITQMLGYAYWNHRTNSKHEVAFNVATVAGCMCGMVTFGFLGDRYGRRKMYGYELLVLMAGTFGLIMSSAGYVPAYSGDGSDVDWGTHGSMNVYALTLFWRFVTGVGIGGDYPLSATLVSEMAPRKKRARMLAAVFSMQAFGSGAAAVVSIVVINIVRHRHPPDLRHDTGLQRAVDQIWRWVMGLGLVPAFVAAMMRLSIPESPRYVLDVAQDSMKAFDEVHRFNTLGNGHTWRRSLELDASASPEPTPKEEVNGSLVHGEIVAQSSSDSEPEVEPTIQLTVKQYFFSPGIGRAANWTILAGTALTWFFLDIGFCALSLNNPKTISKIWYMAQKQSIEFNRVWATNPLVNDPQRDIYDILMTSNQHVLIVSSAGAMAGAIVMIMAIDHVNRKTFQAVSFVVLGLLFGATGASYLTTVGTDMHGITIMFFCLCQFAFYLGAKTTAFVIPAELFPTKYRATCYGITTASGKLGTIIVTVVIGTGNDAAGPKSLWLGAFLVGVALPMFLGALVTHFWIPSLQTKHRENLSLETLAGVRSTALLTEEIEHRRES